jgi:gliding motility-associated protein GldM
MAGGKETPRQKMIGMMYLVLTAMLALNVSATVLDAFVLVDTGLSQTTKSFNLKNERLYTQMDNAYAVNPAKVEPWKNLTDEIRQRSKELFDYIQDLKVLTVVTAEKEDSPALIGDNQVDAKKIKGKGDSNVSGRVFIGSEGGGKATDLKKKIQDYREFMKSHIDPDIGEQIITSIENILNTDDPPASETSTDTHHTWETTRFDHIPLVAVFPQLTKMQLDVLNVEAEVVGYLYNRVDASDFKVNSLDAVVIPKSNYIIQGNEFSADIFLAASDSTQVPRVFIGNYETYTTEQGAIDYRMVGSYKEIPVEGGRGIFTDKSSRLGMNKWSGLLEVTAPDGTKIKRPFNHEYEVAQPNVVVSPTKMNVFYRGVVNPVEISIPGFSADRLIVDIDGGGSIRRVGDIFEVQPGRGNTCNITVMLNIDGQRRPMGSRPFRVREVPTPIAAVQGITSRIVDKNELAASLAIEARMPEGFDFELSFRITSFKVMAQIGGYTSEAISNNHIITQEQQRIFDRLTRGQSVNIIDVKAVGPDGRVRELNDIVYRIR